MSRGFHGGHDFHGHHGFHDDGFVFFGGFGYPYGYGYGYGYYPYGYYPYGDPYGYGYGDAYGYGYGYGSGYGYGYNSYDQSGYRGAGYGRASSVRETQMRLARAGYYQGPIDGVMGPRTRYAIRAYQRSHNPRVTAR